MPASPQIRNLNLKIQFLVHFVFMSVASMGYWCSEAYLFYNSVLIILLIWGLYHDQSHEPVQLAVVVNGTSIFLDILLLSIGFPGSNDSVLSGLLPGGGSQRGDSYEDIDRGHPSQPTGNVGGYDFSSAQQI